VVVAVSEADADTTVAVLTLVVAVSEADADTVAVLARLALLVALAAAATASEALSEVVANSDGELTSV